MTYSSGEEAAAKRPASVKWTLVIMVIFLGFALFTIGGKLIQNDWSGSDIGQYFFGSFRGLLRTLLLTVLSVFIFGGRRRIVYGIGVLLLGSLASVFVWGVSTTRFHFDTAESRGEALTAFLAVSLTLWLFYRFTFGRPSRRYFRIFIRDD